MDLDKLIDGAYNLGVVILTAIGGGLFWMVRTLLTNKAEVELLKLSLESHTIITADMRSDIKMLVQRELDR